MKFVIAMVFILGFVFEAQAETLFQFASRDHRGKVTEVQLTNGQSVTLNGIRVTCGKPEPEVANCNIHGCSRCGTCTFHGCPPCTSGYSGGTCNFHGCWDSSVGSCNIHGCSNYGECTFRGCP